MPDKIPTLSLDAVMSLKGLRYAETSKLVAGLFLSEDIAKEKLETIIDDSYNFEVSLENVYQPKYVMRLDQGPTASFKDFAARMMARLMSAMRPAEKNLNILVATSGDTGSAVGDAFHGAEGISVTILYPKNEISGLQKNNWIQLVGMYGQSRLMRNLMTVRD